MTRYLVTATIPRMGRVQHVIKAATPDDAKAKMLRAHPSAINITARPAEAVYLERSPG